MVWNRNTAQDELVCQSIGTVRKSERLMNRAERRFRPSWLALCKRNVGSEVVIPQDGGRDTGEGLEAELDEELGYSKYDYKNKTGTNSRNGHSRKTMKTSLGDLELAIPRDREGDFEPQLVKKQQTTLAGDIEEKIISMYAKGMTTNDIAAHIMDIY